MSNSKQLVRLIAKVHDLAHVHDVQCGSAATLGKDLPKVLHFQFSSEPPEEFTSALIPVISTYKLYPLVVAEDDGSETLYVSYDQRALRDLVADDQTEKEESKDQE